MLAFLLAPLQWATAFSFLVAQPTGGPSFESGTNAEKLGGAWSVGAEFHVTDAFTASGAGTSIVNGFYPKDAAASGSSDPGTLSYSKNSVQQSCYRTDGFWYLVDQTEVQGTAYISDDDTYENPWDVEEWEVVDATGPAPTLTHPAVQTRIAASTAQGGVAVLGGTQDGVYADRGTLNSKPYLKLLGATPTDDQFYEISWVDSLGDFAWIMHDADGAPLYYSFSDVATPDLASNWKNASDDTPASITVTSVSLGEIYAGLRIINDGVTNGSSYVSSNLHGRQYYMGLNGGGSNNMHWDTDFFVWTDDVGAWTTSNVAFPWQGADNGGGHTGATFSRNDVANEANWQVVP